VDSQDLAAAVLVGWRDVHSPVEAPGAQQGGVQHVRAVGRREHHDAAARVEAVHLGEDLVQRLLALVAATRERLSAAPAPDRVELVDEDDRRGRLLGLTEQVAHPRCAHADDHLDELRGRHREERHACLAGHRARQQRLAGACRAAQQHAVRHPRAQPLVALGIAQELDDLHQLVLDLIDAGHVLERDRRLRGVGARDLRAA
jgi:hypothetical protein